MGAGKTTLGRLLAARRGTPFVDLDDVVAMQSGQSVREVFASAGEAAFRRLELQALEDLVEAAPAGCVLATGGGIVETAAARDLLPQFGRVVWLQADPAACVERLGAARAVRPLLDAPEAWRRRWQEREPHYRRIASLVVCTHPDAPERSLAALTAALGEDG